MTNSKTTCILKAALLWGIPAGLLYAQTPIVQPGAPGQSSKQLTTKTAAAPYRAPTEADFNFMEGMIHHHSQAVDMVELMQTRGENKDLRRLGDRIRISQTDEMQFMKLWLSDHGRPQSGGGHGMGHMAALPSTDHSKMDHGTMNHGDHNAMASMPLMPGMLTPQQMKELAASTGRKFDHLFLTGMIQHHGGALTMVDDLLAVPRAAEDPVLFDFATDIENTQSAEIKIMQDMLSKEKNEK